MHRPTTCAHGWRQHASHRAIQGAKRDKHQCIHTAALVTLAMRRSRAKRPADSPKSDEQGAGRQPGRPNSPEQPSRAMRMSKARSATVESSEAARMSLLVHEGRKSNQMFCCAVKPPPPL
jgi:hypothetical protein